MSEETNTLPSPLSEIVPSPIFELKLPPDLVESIETVYRDISLGQPVNAELQRVTRETLYKLAGLAYLKGQRFGEDAATFDHDNAESE